MAHQPCGQSRQAGSADGEQPGAPTAGEPEVRRWPHPVSGTEPPRQPAAARETGAALYYIHCALSYQNQLLADIKSLLERLSVDFDQTPEEK